MNFNTLRFKSAFKAMSVHFGLSLLVAIVIALLVFTAWFPYPYRELAGGSELFMLVIAVDLVCGPLLTLVLYSPSKPRREMLTDISLIVAIQLLALCYGIWNVWQVRPLYLIHEANSFFIISRSNIDVSNLDFLPTALRPQFLGTPIKVSLQEKTADKPNNINTEHKASNKERIEQSDLYAKYDGIKAYEQAYPIRNLLITQPGKKDQIEKMAISSGIKDTMQLRYTYIVGRQAWLVVLNSTGEFLGFVESI